MLCHLLICRPARFVLGGLLAGLLFGAATSVRAIDIFYTGFEAAEGYNWDSPLRGQQGWQGTSEGGFWNGLDEGLLPGFGQYAYIGFNTPPFVQVGVWRPLNFYPLASNAPVVTFSVVMKIIDRNVPPFNDFQWSVYNTQTNRLFTLDFDNDAWAIFYALDGTNNYVYSGATFQSGVAYGLVITMDFASNSWSATLAGAPIVTNKPITTSGALLTLGDIDAEWIIQNNSQPGDNYMIFDDYRVTARVTVPSRPLLQVTGRLADGKTVLKLTGQSGYAFAIEATTNLFNWTSLDTNSVGSGGFFDYVDNGAAGLPRRYYRARWVP